MQQRSRKARDWHGHLRGDLRLNVESVPRLAAGAVRWVLDDPRGIPYLFVWRLDCRPVSGVPENVEVVRVAALPGGPPPIRSGEEWVSITRPLGQIGCVHALQLLRRPLPRNGGTDVLLLCPNPTCGRPSRYLYAWEVLGRRIISRPWNCRSCARLRYASEGEGRNPWGPYPRDPWDPYVFSSLEQAAKAIGLAGR